MNSTNLNYLNPADVDMAAYQADPSAPPIDCVTCRPDHPGLVHPLAEIDAQAHGAIARTIGSQIAVLLKNECRVLPLDPNAGSIVMSSPSA